MITEETITRCKASLQANKDTVSVEVIEHLEKENTEQKALIEKMKCCRNCKHLYLTPLKYYECKNNSFYFYYDGRDCELWECK